MSQTMSLLKIMSENPDFGARIQRRTAEVKRDKENLNAFADEYSKEYQSEILEGTKLRAKLLTEGSKQGLTEDQIMSGYGRFVPTIYTPIMNCLYFMSRETEHKETALYKTRDEINKILIETQQLDHDDTRDLSSSEISKILGGYFDSLNSAAKDARRNEINQKFMAEKLERPLEEDVKLKDSPEMVEYLYGNVSLDVFNKIKKLKALSKSPNEQEAFQAYRKATALCKEYSLEFDKIPCYVK